MSKILIIEDEQTIVDLISFNLKREGFEVDAAYDGITGLEKALSGWADLILLDVMLPGMNGFDLLGRLRQASDVPVIMVTAREEERDKVFGLETGADDYMTKPFSVKELIARIKANTRRKSGGNRQGGSRMGFGPYIVDTGLQEVRRADTAVELTQREYDLVCYFLTSAGRVISREELMEKVWGYDYYGDLRAVDVAMRRLREKLEEDPANPKYFMTKRGAGYYLQKLAVPGAGGGFLAVCDGAPLMRRNAAAGAGAPAKAINDPGPPQKRGLCGETDPANPK